LSSQKKLFLSREELAAYRLLRPLLQARFFAEQSRGVLLKIEEEEAAWGRFCKIHKVDLASPGSVPREFLGLAPERLREVALDDERVARWKETTFGAVAADYFEKNRQHFERVVYRLLRIADVGIAREIWFRLREGEATFEDLAPQHAGGAEKYTAGFVGPVLLSAMHPGLAERLRRAQEGELLEPFPVNAVYLIARLEKRLPAVLDENLRASIVENMARELFDKNTAALSDGC
jgi:hypothetical protein